MVRVLIVHPDTLDSMKNLAAIYENQGRYAAAEPLYTKCLEGRKVNLGEDHLHTLSSMNDLAKLYHTQGRYDAAEPLYKKRVELKIFIKIIVKNHINLSHLFSAYGNLIYLLFYFFDSRSRSRSRSTEANPSSPCLPIYITVYLPCLPINFSHPSYQS